MACASLESLQALSLVPFNNVISCLQVPALRYASETCRSVHKHVKAYLAAAMFGSNAPAVGSADQYHLDLSEWRDIANQCLTAANVDMATWLRSAMRADVDLISKYLQFLTLQCLPRENTSHLTHLLFADSWRNVHPKTTPDTVMDIGFAALALTSERSFAIFVAKLEHVIADDGTSFVQGRARMKLEASVVLALEAMKAMFVMGPMEDLCLYLQAGSIFSDDDEVEGFLRNDA